MADYYRKKLPPEIQPMQTLPVKNYQGPGIYADQYHSNPAELAGLRNEMGPEFNREADWTAKQRADKANVAQPTERRRSGGRRGRVRGMKLGHFKGRANAKMTAAFLNVLPPTMNMASNQVVTGWNLLAKNPNAGRLSNKEQSAYVHAKSGPTTGFGQPGDFMERQRTLAKLGAKLNPMSRLSGRRRFSYQVARDRAERRRKWRA